MHTPHITHQKDGRFAVRNKNQQKGFTRRVCCMHTCLHTCQPLTGPLAAAHTHTCAAVGLVVVEPHRVRAAHEVERQKVVVAQNSLPNTQKKEKERENQTMAQHTHTSKASQRMPTRAQCC
jgi:hypothetical protein